MKYAIVITKQYKKAFKRIKNNKALVNELESVIDLLALDKKIPREYKDHQLVGNLKAFRELHVRSDILLLYKKEKDLIVLLLANLGSHSDLFR